MSEDETMPPNPDAEETLHRKEAAASRAAGQMLLGRYRILNKLGQGAMGAVFRCHDEIGGIDVAIKTIPPELSRDENEMKEVRENFRLVEQLHHPNIAGIKTLEQDPASDEYYVVMECIDGMDLNAWKNLKGVPMSLADAAPVLRQIASALDYAHSRKIMHRDIKPGNIMVADDGTVKVLDFGLASQIHESMSRISQVQVGISGTALYMAPEQWRGQYQDGATDQYALACVAHVLLAGRCPFEGSNITVLREAAINEPPVPPNELSPIAGKALERGLAKAREDRHATCTELVDALEGKATARPGKKSSATRGISVLVAVALIAGAAWFFTQQKDRSDGEAQPPPTTPPQVVDNTVQQEQATKRRVEVSLARDNVLKATASTHPDVQQLLEELEIQWRLAESYFEQGGFEQAVTAYQDTQARVTGLEEMNRRIATLHQRVADVDELCRQIQAKGYARLRPEVWKALNINRDKLAEYPEQLAFAKSDVLYPELKAELSQLLNDPGLVGELSLTTVNQHITNKAWDQIVPALQPAIGSGVDSNKVFEVLDTIKLIELPPADLHTLAKYGHPRSMTIWGIRSTKKWQVANDEQAKTLTEWIRPAAERGDPLAQAYDADLRYFTERERHPKNGEEIFQQMEARAKDNWLPEMAMLGTLLIKGIGTETNTATGIAWRRNAADAGYPPAQIEYAQNLEWGRHVNKDEVKAVHYAQLAAEAGMMDAMARLARYHHSGIGVDKDHSTAFHWYKKAAEVGDPYAELMTAKMMLTGSGTTVNPPQAALILEKLQGRYPDAKFHLGRLHETGNGVVKDLEKALTLYRAAAEKDSRQAKVQLAICQRDGIGMKPDPAAALITLQAEAEADNLEAHQELGIMYFDGITVPRNFDQAFEHLDRASYLPRARTYRARCQLDGLGTRPYIPSALRNLEEASAESDLDACALLGWLLAEGAVVDADPERARALLVQASEAGHENGRIYLVQAYEKKYLPSADGNTSDYLFEQRRFRESDNPLALRFAGEQAYGEDAFTLFVKAADKGDPFSMHRVGKVYYYGKDGAPQDETTGLDWWHKAAALGNAEARHSLAIHYMALGDENTSYDYLEMASRQGHKESTALFAYFHVRGWGLKVPLGKVAFKMLEDPAVAETMHGQLALGWIHDNGLAGDIKDPKQAMIHYRKASSLGSGEAQAKIGIHYLYGLGVEQDYKQARSWFEGALREGDDPLASFGLAIIFFNGFGVEKDHPRALENYLVAAAENFAPAQAAVGSMYMDGEGTKKDYEKAFEWLSKAADGGDPGAMNNLGILYGAGRGVKRDKQKAAAWFKKAADHGNERAANNLKKL